MLTWELLVRRALHFSDNQHLQRLRTYIIHRNSHLWVNPMAHCELSRVNKKPSTNNDLFLIWTGDRIFFTFSMRSCDTKKPLWSIAVQHVLESKRSDIRKHCKTNGNARVVINKICFCHYLHFDIPGLFMNLWEGSRRKGKTGRPTSQILSIVFRRVEINGYF